ncbi:HAD family hydrolase [Cryobacterium adonitolivorans]|uniref:HAD family hydrolase n=1 Tax=Cryobacterium adonitolivorans TaxID=1259189 RepID=A0A4V3ICV0_9MICO|nr:Cof-type HAD-IIB family hydrolase [Cryobacterium adonitolivorans]TFC03208.1 HAD family hydrolase [Cryobacterium adonitolivorans]
MTHPREPVAGQPSDIRLIASDMDGTLLDADGTVPERFWPLLDSILAAGILFSPASGRQYQTLQAVFGDRDGLVYIAENGTNIVQGGVSIALEPVVGSIIAPVVAWVRAQTAAGSDLGIVVCGARSAYIERTDEAFVAQVRPYYAALAMVDDVTVAAAGDDVLKLAIFDAGRAETRTGPAVLALDLAADVVVSGTNWVDIMRPGTNKGTALIHLQQHLGIRREQTMAFGDYLNDAEMLDAAWHSYAVANAHPSIRARARHQAPSNLDEGVITSILAALPALAPAPA